MDCCATHGAIGLDGRDLGGGGSGDDDYDDDGGGDGDGGCDYRTHK